MRRSYRVSRAMVWVVGGVLASCLTLPTAEADSFGSYGSSGGFASSGGYASSGGHASSGGYASSGGFAHHHGGSSGGTGPVRRLLGRIHDRVHDGLDRLHSRHRHHGSSGGSSGGFNGGSSGGSSGGYVVYGGSFGSSGGSSGGFGSSGGSSGGSVGGATSYRPEIILEDPAPAEGQTEPGTPLGRSSLRDNFDSNLRTATGGINELNQRVRAVTSQRTGNAVLTLNVPEEAVVYVNNHRMKTQGTERRFVAKNLSFDRSNTYEIRVVTTENGRELEQTKVIDLTPERPASLAFNFNREVAPVTSLTLRVPADAKVRLAGVDTVSGGHLRYFYTNALPAGEVWDEYQVEVEWEVDGEAVVKQQKVQLKSGQPIQLDFLTDATTHVASR